MRVRIGDSYSSPRSVPGGSPQGSILGNYLFCMATDELDKNIAFPLDINTSEVSCAMPSVEEEVHGGADRNLDPLLARIITEEPSEFGLNNITVLAEIPELCPPLSRNGVDVDDSGDESVRSSEDDLDSSFHFFRPNRPGIIHDTPEPTYLTQREIVEHIGPIPGWTPRPLRLLKYIDDFNALEKTSVKCSVSDYSTSRACLLYTSDAADE